MKLIEPVISVMVCTYNRCDLLKGALQSLSEQTLDKEQYEVIVVDNNSTDNTWQITQEFAAKHVNVKVIKEVKQGKSYALNTGIAKSKGKYVAFMDDDAKAYPDWLERIVEAFETVKPEPAAVGGMILPWYEQTPPEWFTDDLEIRTWGEEKRFLEPPRAKYGFSGSNMALPKKVLEFCGGFVAGTGPEGDKFAIGDEVALYNKIYWECPWFWYDPAIKVEHFVPIRKMKVCYRIKRAYLGGVSMALLQERLPILFVARAVLFIVIKGILLPVYIQWWHREWQKSFLKHTQPVAGAFGTLKGLIFNEYSRIHKGSDRNRSIS